MPLKEVESRCKKISQFFHNVNEQLADPTSIQSLSYDCQAVEAMNFESTAEQFAVAFLRCTLCVVIFSVLLIFAPLMKQCKNFMFDF